MRNKKFFLIIYIITTFFSGCTHFNASFIHKNIKIENINKIKDKELKSRIEEFYYYLKKKDYRSMYEMESPSFRYFYDFKLYKAFYFGYKKFDEIELLKVKKAKKGDFKVLKLQFKKKDGNINFIIYDEWIKINGTYYHNLYDPFIFNK